MKCPYCKKEIPDQAKFCGFCGEKIGDSVNYTKSEPQMTKRRKKSWLILLVLVIVACLFLVLLNHYLNRIEKVGDVDVISQDQYQDEIDEPGTEDPNAFVIGSEDV